MNQIPSILLVPISSDHTDRLELFVMVPHRYSSMAAFLVLSLASALELAREKGTMLDAGVMAANSPKTSAEGMREDKGEDERPRMVWPYSKSVRWNSSVAD